MESLELCSDSGGGREFVARHSGRGRKDKGIVTAHAIATNVIFPSATPSLVDVIDLLIARYVVVMGPEDLLAAAYPNATDSSYNLEQVAVARRRLPLRRFLLVARSTILIHY